MDETPRPPRRKRYSGRNPRRFEDKYKEHGGDPETTAKVLEAGKTPAGTHVPILVEEVLTALQPGPGMTGVDATLGYGGHAAELLARMAAGADSGSGSGTGGLLLGLDVDPQEQPRTEARLRERGYGPEIFRAVRSNYAGLRKVLDAENLAAVDFIFADLGCSSMQIDDPARGFSWKAEGPLDMRMNPGRGVSAAEWLMKVKAPKLAEVLVENADEPLAEEIAAALAGRSLPGTRDLQRAVLEVPQVAKLDAERAELAVRRVFQAVRIAVNDEFAALDAFLRVLPACLKPGGRVAVLTFHSGEDRRVKKAFQAGEREGLWSQVSDGVVQAGPEERRANPRSIPAKLRWAVKAATGA